MDGTRVHCVLCTSAFQRTPNGAEVWNGRCKIDSVNHNIVVVNWRRIEFIQPSLSSTITQNCYTISISILLCGVRRTRKISTSNFNDGIVACRVVQLESESAAAHNGKILFKKLFIAYASVTKVNEWEREKLRYIFMMKQFRINVVLDVVRMAIMRTR